VSVAGGLLIGIAWGAASTDVVAGLLTIDAGAGNSLEEAGTFTCTVSSITDGDTFRCAETEADGKQIRVRLSGIATREKDGSCTAGHPCPKAAIEALAMGKALRCRQVGSTFGRRAAFCLLPGGKDLSCATDLTVDVEMYPDRYVLKPGDVMQITYDHNGQGYGLHTLIWPSGLQVYLEEFAICVCFGIYTILNGKRS
jgi:hypothetical protein